MMSDILLNVENRIIRKKGSYDISNYNLNEGGEDVDS